MKRFLFHALWIAFPAALILGITLWIGALPAHALPEYATRTGQPCATCHVNPGGGGPRTLRGLLWAARGRPDQVPDLPGALIAPGVNDGAELYSIACAGCHGAKGEGLSGMALVKTGVSPNAIRSYVVHGIPTMGMPKFDGQLKSDQLDKLVDYVAGLSSGAIAPPPDEYSLPEAHFICDRVTVTAVCKNLLPISNGGN